MKKINVDLNHGYNGSLEPSSHVRTKRGGEEMLGIF
jgi:hypothetical protein